MSEAAEKQPVLLPRQVVPTKYTLHLEPDLETFDLAGDLSIAVNVAEATSEVSVHARDLHFLKVEFTGSDGVTKQASQISSNLATSKFPYVTTFSFATHGETEPALSAGDGVLHIVYRGELNDQMAGFYRSKYKSVEGEEKIMASTQFEALDARRCFPCWDEPDVKATFECTLTVADHLTAFSNMPETEVTLLSGGKKRIAFAESPKMSTYLLAFCVGEFDFVQAYTKGRVAVRVYTPPGKKALGTFSLDAAVRSLDFYDDFFGVPYPLPKLDMVAIPEFAMGAMENWGLVTYREVDLLIDVEKASSQQKQRVCTVVTHELAHQWFGNLVTMKWWDNLWLNEGFASWMQNFAADYLYPEWKMWDQFTTNAMSIARAKDALRSSHPIQVPIAHAEEVEEVFDAISYYKGACVVRMVFAVVGEEHFREGLRRYFQKYGYGNTVTTELWDAWSEVSGKDVAKLMGMWTGRMGFPVVNVTAVDAATGNVTVSQEWFLGDGSQLSEEEQGFLWNVPLLIATGEDISTESPTLVMMTGKTQTLKGIAAGGAPVLLNAGQQSLFRVNYGEELLGRLASSMDNLSAIDRASLISDNLALAKAGKVPLEQVLTLLATCSSEKSFVVWDVVKDTLGFLKPKIMEMGTEVYDKFLTFAGKLAASCLADRGWSAQPTDGHLDTLLRAMGISMSLSYNNGDAGLLAEVRSRFDAYAADPSGSNGLAGDLIVPVFRYLLKNGGEAEYEALMRVYATVETNVEKKNVLLSLGAASTPELKLRTMQWSLEEVKLQDFFYPFYSVSSAGPEGRDIAFNFFRNNFAAIHGKVRNASPSLMNACILYCCSAFSTHDKADMLQEFLLQEKGDVLKANKRCIDQMLETMRANAEFIENCKKSPVAQVATWDTLLAKL